MQSAFLVTNTKKSVQSFYFTYQIKSNQSRPVTGTFELSKKKKQDKYNR